MSSHSCYSHEEWLQNVHYMCSCGHVEWAHYGERLAKTACAHCNCRQYNGETRPLTSHEINLLADKLSELRLDDILK